VSDPGAGNNNLNFRVSMLERRLDKLEDGKPDVVSERVARLSKDVVELRHEFQSEIKDLREDDLSSLREELATQRKILIGAFISIATALIVAYVLGSGGVGA
jgi:predicted  nucleic acid-binding Zn-ribbon protein